MKQYYIYITTNIANQMKYIGKHYGELNDTYLGSGKLLKQAIKEYGENNFIKEILYISKDEQENCKKEKEYISLYNATINPLFYNIHEGGGGGNTIAGYSEEERNQLKEKLRILNSGKNNGMYGKHHSDKTKQLLSYWASIYRDNDKYRTTEFKQKMSAVTSGEKNGMYGKHHSDESKYLMSINSIGKTTGEKNGMYNKKLDNAINGKWIGMYDINGQLIHTFKAKTAVLNYLQVKGHSKLNDAIKNNTLYKNYYWKEIDKDKSVETN